MRDSGLEAAKLQDGLKGGYGPSPKYKGNTHELATGESRWAGLKIMSYRSYLGTRATKARGTVTCSLGALTVATILLTAAADSSSPLGRSTSVIPRYLRLKTMPSSSVSRVSVQFSGNSRTGQASLSVLSRPGSQHPPPQHAYKGPRGAPTLTLISTSQEQLHRH